MMDPEEFQDAELYPPWKQALDLFEQAGFQHGDTVPKAWFEAAFELPVLDDQARLTLAQYQQRQFLWLQNFVPFRQALLERAQMDLRTDQRGGYLIVPPSEQATTAYRDMTRQVRKAFEDGQRRIANTDIGQLSMEERKALSDLAAQAAFLAQMVSRRKRLPLDDDD